MSIIASLRGAAGVESSSAIHFAVDSAINALSPDDRARLLERAPRPERSLAPDVTRIIARVRTSGDTALFEMAQQFDGVRLSALEVPRLAWDAARGSLDHAVLEALLHARQNIERFHRELMPAAVAVEIEPGLWLSRRTEPLRRIGVYVPGGQAAYPSSVLMGVVPARVAGVEEVVICSPPGPDGQPAAVVLAACAIAGADRVFAVGGAGAIAAMAYGTASVPRVDRIVGPGNT